MKLRMILLILLSLAMGFLVESAEVFHKHSEDAMSQGTHKFTNKLAQEKSPYLLQHAHNPVDWYPWSPEAFEKAKKEDKPIFLSIGYSTCHWCHVMERESFENEEIARVMNEHFVSIKVDREERPDVDQIYMNAVQGMTGSGGWPLSAFLTHDLEPFWGGTYFPPESRWGRPGFKDILLEIARIWREDRTKLTEAGREVSEALKKADRTAGAGAELSVETLRRAYTSFQGLFDAQEGGFGGAPKFPRSETISLLLRIHRRTGEARALHMARLTLEKMARGGIYDHLGGGFHRYSTDDRWIVPHFEKMLYDNALLARSYLEAGQVDPNPMWTGVARETLDYVLRVMTSPEGGFYSAEDADSEGVEGKCYVWKEEELQKLLTPEEFRKVKEVFQVSPHGNWEGNSILHMNMGTPWVVRYEEPMAGAMKKLLSHRNTRMPPHKDDKVLVSWNGLMIGAMSYAAQVLDENDARYLTAAQKAADFVLRTMWDGQDLRRRYRQGDVRFAASLDDYAFLIQGLLDLYETDFDMRWFTAAVALQKRCDELFWDAKDGGYFFTDARDSSLIARSKDVYDGAVPSGNSVAALNLLRLYDFTLDDDHRKKAQALLKVFADFVSGNPHASPALLMALDYATDASKEIVVAGAKDDPKARGMIRKIHVQFLPNKVLALADRAGREKDMPLLEGKIPQNAAATLYLCENHTCRKPVHSVEEAGEAFTKVNAYKLY